MKFYYYEVVDNKMPTSSLTDQCYQKLIEILVSSPPGFQEMVMKETKDRIEKRIHTKILETHINTTTDKLSYIVPDIMSHMINVIINPEATHPNYEKLYPNINPIIVRSAVLIAQQAVRIMEYRYVTQAFGI